jgi:transcriptional regulator
MFSNDSGLLQGTLELLVLKTLSWGPMHGYGVAKWIESATDDVLRIEEGSLYPALYRMSRRGWIKGAWGVSENNRRAERRRDWIGDLKQDLRFGFARRCRPSCSHYSP